MLLHVFEEIFFESTHSLKSTVKIGVTIANYHYLQIFWFKIVHWVWASTLRRNAWHQQMLFEHSCTCEHLMRIPECSPADSWDLFEERKFLVLVFNLARAFSVFGPSKLAPILCCAWRFCAVFIFGASPGLSSLLIVLARNMNMVGKCARPLWRLSTERTVSAFLAAAFSSPLIRALVCEK